jgi:hypothetical protein
MSGPYARERPAVSRRGTGRIWSPSFRKVKMGESVGRRRSVAADAPSFSVPSPRAVP